VLREVRSRKAGCSGAAGAAGAVGIGALLKWVSHLVK
jgi:hypothetical protein